MAEMQHNPGSRLIRWIGRIGVLPLIAIPFAVGLVRFGFLDYTRGLPVFALACLVSLLVLVLLLVISFLPRYQRFRQQALMRSLLAVPPVLLMGSVLAGSGDYPMIHDVTTDPDDPPTFIVGKLVRKADTNTLDIKPDVIAIQRESYPDLTTIITPLGPADALARAEEVAESLEWVVYNLEADKGLLEASYTSFWWGFTDDIVIRVRNSDQGTEVDLRSISRVGQGDLGANAERIRAFMQAFND